MATVRIPVSLPFRNCGNDKSGSFTEAEAYHSFYRKLARRHFNPRARGARRFCATAAPSSPSCFNPRAPRGARPATSTEPTATWEFQPTRPCGARHRRSGGRKRVVMFQSTRPCGARPRRSPGWARSSRFQPTRPYGARLPSRCTAYDVDGVSTHAPLWGATIREAVRYIAPMFQPTRPYGARHARRNQRRDLASSFNPRAPMGRDERAADVLLRGPRFQPTRPYGARLAGALTKVSRSLVSTHAPLWGATRFSRAISATSSSFNPRAPMGRDAEPRSRRLCVVVSTHAPLWGATSPSRHRPWASPVSTHAPLWGATSRQIGGEAATGVSTHAPLWGATSARCPACRSRRGFNPRAPMGRDGGSRKA